MYLKFLSELTDPFLLLSTAAKPTESYLIVAATPFFFFFELIVSVASIAVETFFMFTQPFSNSNYAALFSNIFPNNLFSHFTLF